MRSFTVFACTIAVTACSGTEGDILRTRPDGSVTERPRPAPLSTWQIQLRGALDTTVDVRSYTVDVATPASVIGGLHAAGRIVLCYFSAGTFEPFRDDAARFPASTLGAPLASYPDERWVDIRDATVRAIMQDRIIAAAGAGCDGVHPSGLAAFQESTNLDFTRADQVGYDRWLTTVAHGLGLSIGLVQADAALSQDLVADFDWAVLWTCLDTDCAPAAPFTAAGKPVFLIEYGDETRAADVCPKARALGLSAIIKRDGNLDAFRVGCP
jgi:hypothetical protein